MTKRTRIFIGILVAYALGVAFLMYRQLGDIDPRYRESAEDSLVDAAQLMAALIENASPGGELRTDALEPVFRSLYARRFSAEIYGVEKTRVELRMTVVDRQGTVVFDSRAAAAAAAVAASTYWPKLCTGLPTLTTPMISPASSWTGAATYITEVRGSPSTSGVVRAP